MFKVQWVQKVKAAQLETVAIGANQERGDSEVSVVHLVLLVLLAKLVKRDLLGKSALKVLRATPVKREDAVQRDPLDQWVLREMQVNVVCEVILVPLVQLDQKENQVALVIAVQRANKVNPVQWEMKDAKVTLVHLVMMVNKDPLDPLVQPDLRVFKGREASVVPLAMLDPRVHKVLLVRSRSSIL